MGRADLWLEAFDKVERSHLRNVEGMLGDRGMECRRLKSGSARGPGLVLLGEVSDRLLDRLRGHSRRCGGRLLAAVVRKRALSEGELWSLLAAGAADVLCWPRLEDPAAAVAARLERWREVDRLLRSRAVTRNLIGETPVWRDVLSQIVEVARFSDASVLVSGESGTGKELAARLVHTLDAREEKGELILVDCTTLSPELSGSELFGHERGAFTHAHRARDGAFALADGGTLFLDEIGELPRKLQAELLRVIQEGTYKRLGANHWKQARFRLLCATHRDLAGEVAAGRFRGDLYRRLATWSCRLPSLRRRRQDIPLLVDHFLCQELQVDRAPEVEPAILEVLTARDYPGNVRELKQLVARIGHRHVGGGPISAGDLPAEERPAPADLPAVPWNGDPLEGAVARALDQGAGLEEIKNQAADAAVRLAVAEEPDQQRAAERLGISRRAVQMRLAAMRERDA